METEDFSFPTIGSTSSRYIDSPPLWNTSPAASPPSCHQEKAQEAASNDESKNYHEDQFCLSKLKMKSSRQSNRFSYVKMVKGNDQDGDHEEERMDLLWEDFNEESSRSRNLSAGEKEELGCVQGLKLVRSRGTVILPRKPGMVVIFKVLKRLLLLHNSHRRTLKKSA